MNFGHSDNQLPMVHPPLPADLAEWLGAVRLTRLTHDAVESVEASHGPGPHQTSNEPSSSALLKLFTYGLARGISESDELERRAVKEPALRHLCANSQPSASDLRRFRRRHRAEIETALSRVLGAAWGECEGQSNLAPALALEARHRVLESVRADSLAQDN